MSSTHVNFAPSKFEFFEFVAERNLYEAGAARYWEYANQTNWRLRDGSPIRNWRQCLLNWLERVDKPARHERRPPIDEHELQLRRAETLVRCGRKAGASDERIIAALQGRGLLWPGEVSDHDYGSA